MYIDGIKWEIRAHCETTLMYCQISLQVLSLKKLLYVLAFASLDQDKAKDVHCVTNCNTKELSESIVETSSAPLANHSTDA